MAHLLAMRTPSACEHMATLQIHFMSCHNADRERLQLMETLRTPVEWSLESKWTLSEC